MCILFTYTCNITQLSLFCSRLYAFYISCSLTFVLPIEMARLSGVQNTCTPRTKTHRFFFLLTLCIIRLSQHIKLFSVFDLFFYSYHHHHPCTVTPPPPTSRPFSFSFPIYCESVCGMEPKRIEILSSRLFKSFAQ